MAFVIFAFSFIRKLKQRHYKGSHPLLSQTMRNLSSKLEIVLCSNFNDILFTTHPGDYQSWQDFTLKVTLRFAQDQQQEIKQWLDSGRSGERLVKGLDSDWWIVSVVPSDGGSRLVTLQSVTSHLDGYDQLQKRYNKLESFLDKAPFGFFYTSKTGHIVALNTTMASWLGQDRSKVLGQNIHSFLKVHELDQPQMVTVDSGKDSEPFRALFVPPSKNSEHKNASLLCRVDWLTAVEDYGAIFMETPLPAVLMNHTGEILATNLAFDRMLPEEEKKQWQNGAKCTLISKNKLEESRDTKVAFECTLAGNSTTAIIGNIDGIRRLVLFIDISEQKRLEEQFTQSQKMQAIGQLAGGIAHDFNNLLTAMMGFCDLILQRLLPNDPSYVDVTHIKQNANRAANLVRQLLAFSRQQTLKPTIVNPTDVLAELAALLRRLIGASITLDLHHGQGLWPIKVDVSQLEQVIINLAVNARDAMTSGGKLSIQTSCFHNEEMRRMGHDRMSPGDYVLIKVSDTGCGISSDNIEHIFEPFFSTKEIGAGTGLGLSTVYGIVKQTGGLISVESVVNEGTTFNIYLPRHIGADAHNDNENTVRENPDHMDLTGQANILLAEDEDAVRLFSSRALRDKGYNVLEADNGEAALSILNDKPNIDLIVTDVIMPKMDGPTLAKHVREFNKVCPIIFTSGYAEDNFRQTLDRDTHMHFLAKPYTLKELATKIKCVLNESQKNATSKAV